MPNICKGITLSGKRCTRKIKSGNYCYQHLSKNKDEGKKKEKLEKEKLEKERIEREKKEKEKIERERKEKIEREKKEKIEKERKERKEKEKEKEKKCEKRKSCDCEIVEEKSFNKECCICLDEFEEDKIRGTFVTVCKHKYHTECLKSYLKKYLATDKKLCAICKSDLKNSVPLGCKWKVPPPPIPAEALSYFDIPEALIRELGMETILIQLFGGPNPIIRAVAPPVIR